MPNKAKIIAFSCVYQINAVSLQAKSESWWRLGEATIDGFDGS